MTWDHIPDGRSDLTIAADKELEFLIRGISEYGSDTTSWKVLSSLAFTVFQKVKWGKKTQKTGNRVTWILETEVFKQLNFI